VLRRYLQERMLDQATVTELRDVLALYGRLDDIAIRYGQLEAQRQRIYEQQTQIRGNLDVLEKEGEEGELRTRYITTLADTENRLVALQEEETALREEETQRRTELDERLQNFGTR
jgi:hypothetical protein